MTNLLVIVADDMRFDHLPYMSNVRNLIQSRGQVFDQARCNIALCQPNRTCFLTGQNSLHHGETDVGYQGAGLTDHDNTIGSWLMAAGYRTAMLGKYLNYPDEWGGMVAPKGWSTWRELTRDASAVKWRVRVDREKEQQITGRYQCEYLADEAISFMDGGQPWFCYIAPKHPHAPFSPESRDLHGWAHRQCRIVELDDVERKPPWIQKQFRLVAGDVNVIQQDFRGRLRELAAVDRMVARVLRHLHTSGQADDTVVVFSSDNGVHQGEQRRTGAGTKGGPYDVGLRVPLLVSGPGFRRGPTVQVPTYPAEDVTATLLDIAGAKAGLEHQAGISLATLVDEPAAHRERVLLHECGGGFPATADGVTTGPDHPLGHLKLFRFPAQRTRKPGDRVIYEMYDLRRDPDELDNLADLPAHRPVRDRLEKLLDEKLAR